MWATLRESNISTRKSVAKALREESDKIEWQRRSQKQRIRRIDKERQINAAKDATEHITAQMLAQKIIRDLNHSAICF